MIEPIALVIAFSIIVFAIYAVFRLTSVHHEVVNLFKFIFREQSESSPDPAEKETSPERQNVKPERSRSERELSSVE